MEIFKLSIDVIRREKKRFDLDETMYHDFISLSFKKLDAFSRPYNRCAFMYHYATRNTCFLQDCIELFLNENPKAKDLLASWRAHSDRSICSLSCGPGLDYLALSLAVLDFGETLNPLKKVKIISKYGAWRNTVSLLSKSIEKYKKSSQVPEQLNFQNVKVIKGDIFGIFTEKMIGSLQNCEVLLMFKALYLGKDYDKMSHAPNSTLKVLVTTLKPATTIFFLDTKPRARAMLKTLDKFPGTFLYDPYHFPYDVDIKIPKKLLAKLGVLPVLIDQGVFFVWQKSSLLPDVTITPEHIRSMNLTKKEVKLFEAAEFSSSDSLAKEWYTIEHLSNSSSPVSRTSNINSNFNPSQLSSTEVSSVSLPAPKECFCHDVLSKQSEWQKVIQNVGDAANDYTEATRNHVLFNFPSFSIPGCDTAGEEKSCCKVGCDHACSGKGCYSKPVQIQCCQTQYTLQSHLSPGPLFVSGPVNVTVPSIVIPLENINRNILSQILSDVKIEIKSIFN